MTRGLRGRSQLRPALPDLDNANAGNIALAQCLYVAFHIGWSAAFFNYEWEWWFADKALIQIGRAVSVYTVCGVACVMGSVGAGSGVPSYVLPTPTKVVKALLQTCPRLSGIQA